MGILMVTYRHRPRALCTRRRVFLLDTPDCGTPDLPFVLAMCVYAGAILNRRLPGPYLEADARAFARSSLIPSEITERGPNAWDLGELSRWLGVPERELLAQRRRGCESRARRAP
ncbi:hypothetical protein [Solirubrobacter deserti]|uniref:GS catalytic domain-containing protein n=1 Tax=Solirubrobacter deserti TaxID=2282478 RepID=A0ABT4RLI2_9ACTN|nr:hypothetical protein [Solirubrobacter deserti]MDA0139413.1 hypothetical protein [Solirubrobacter deserti]